jgi:serine/threonine protein kinase
MKLIADTDAQPVPAAHTSTESVTSTSSAMKTHIAKLNPLPHLYDLQEEVANLEAQVAEHVSTGKDFRHLIKERDTRRRELGKLAETVPNFVSLCDLLQRNHPQPSQPSEEIIQATQSIRSSKKTSMESVRKVEEALLKRAGDLADARCKIARSLNDLNKSLADYVHLTHAVLAVENSLELLTYDDVRQEVWASLNPPSPEEQFAATRLAEDISTRWKNRKRCRDELEKLDAIVVEARGEMVQEAGNLVDYEASHKKARLTRQGTSEWEEKIKIQKAAVKKLQAKLWGVQKQVLNHPAVHDFPEFLPESAAPAVSSELTSPFSADDFEMLKRLSGTMFSIVQHVRHKVTGAELVLKEVLHAKDFEREVCHLQKLRHPLILPIEKVFMGDNRMIMQLPYLPLGSLRSWFETQKVPETRNLAQIRMVMQQVFQAVSYIHSRGVVHRDLKPENILWIRENRIVLCDFGLSRTIEGGSNPTVFFPTLSNVTMLNPVVLTPAYAAPELLAGDEKWTENPSALDLWSLGIMLRELCLRKLASGPADAAHKQCPDFDDQITVAMWNLAADLLAKDPAQRITVNEALLSLFFQAGSMTDSLSAMSLAERVEGIRTFVASNRKEGRKKLPVRLSSVGAVKTLDIEKFLPRWHTTLHENGKLVELSEFIKIFWDQAVEQGLLEQCDKNHALFQTFLPSTKSTDKDTAEKFKLLGRVLAKAVLEGVPIEINFSVVLFEFLRGMDAVNAFFANRIDVLQAVKAFEPQMGQMLGKILRQDFKQGNTLETVAMYLGGVGITDSIDERPVDNINKHDLVFSMARHLLVDSRIKQLESMREGFYSVLPEIETKLKLLSGHEIALVMMGNGFVDRDAVKKLLEFDPDKWDANAGTTGSGMTREQAQVLLNRFLDNTSVLGLRSLILRTLGTLNVSTHEPQRVLVLPHEDPKISLPHFDSNSKMIFLPGDAVPYEKFCARMIIALQLGLRDGLAEVQNIDRAEVASIVEAMRGEIRPGGWYRCPCGSPYAIGECGGANEEARCPECGGKIGGQSHRLIENNQNDLTMDGASRPLGWNQNARIIR